MNNTGKLFGQRMSRLEDWEERLFTWLDQVSKDDLEWGNFDCVCGLACGAVERQTGVDFSFYKPDYSSERDALKIILRHGGIANILDMFLNRTVTRHRGNLILLNGFKGLAVGVRTGSHALFMTPHGLQPKRITGDFVEWSMVK